MGSVRTGDYIVGKGDILGYGIAVSPENMTIEDFKHSVGRAWQEDISKGPKMINTVVGIHNGDYRDILKRYDDRLKSYETRLKNIESKLDSLILIYSTH